MTNLHGYEAVAELKLGHDYGGPLLLVGISTAMKPWPN
ncbi:hypothetical protein FRUB_06441 [Fimbriiglobus ruber]|uniref:Uncharacterized protein n=1 Tax=Fimbriiglobus ruber TaxID=1908690 RepID=A0A225D6X5_9BACT|nr:hypothetical protein FRUB_06441 [Fimbriiglobus ruber]